MRYLVKFQHFLSQSKAPQANLKSQAETGTIPSLFQEITDILGVVNVTSDETKFGFSITPRTNAKELEFIEQSLARRPGVCQNASLSYGILQGDEQDVWSAVQERALIQALKTFPKETSQHWERVATAVPGKTNKGLSLDPRYFEILIKGLCRADRIADALEILDIMKTRQLVSEKVMLAKTLYPKHGKYSIRLEERGIRPYLESIFSIH
ncbi:hypothetical protein GOBAR_AA22795 [Gossypium barbadense]|uniref:Uncharacterized protein n=1 Tax=Gossypium barbadense TaxID=3634 RepID=A0A2P5X3D6_GOSBA|nr:hypothetical protein GOBAR_AA22795 [Gossypium barbadense]